MAQAAVVPLEGLSTTVNLTESIEERLAGRRSSGVAFSDTEVLRDGGVMEEALTVGLKAVEDRGGGAPTLYAGYLTSLGSSTKRTTTQEERTHLYTGDSPTGQGRQCTDLPHGKRRSMS